MEASSEAFERSIAPYPTPTFASQLTLWIPLALVKATSEVCATARSSSHSAWLTPGRQPPDAIVQQAFQNSEHCASQSPRFVQPLNGSHHPDMASLAA